MSVDDCYQYTMAKLDEVAIKLGGRACLASRLGVTHTALWKWYDNGRVPLTSLENFVSVADFAGVEVSAVQLRPDFFTPDLLAAL